MSRTIVDVDGALLGNVSQSTVGMTKSQLYQFVTSLTGGVEIETTAFDLFLEIAQMRIEGLRPWVILRTSDTSQTVSPAEPLSVSYNFPTDFAEFYDEEESCQLVDSNGNPITLKEIPYAQRFRYKNANGRFCVDYANNKIYILGNINGTFTLNINYIGISTLVSIDDNNMWIFPPRFHKILGLMIAIMWRKGIDYDVFNQPLADNQEMQVREIYDIMTRWDSNLQYSMQRGKDFSSTNSIGAGSQSGGQVNY